MVMGSLERLDPPRRLGKLTLLARLGEGGMASVYVASVGDGPLARLAAVKLLRAGVPDNDYTTRFLDEAKVVVRLHHNNIVDVREAGEVDGRLYIAMELIEGRDLSDVWDRCAKVGKAFPVPLAVYLVREILRGLHYAHTFPGLGVVHRDISPSNVLMDWAGAVRLADFGLATSAMKATKTVAGLVFGKVGYMAPEQAVRGELDGRADVYGCGVVLWELITGRPFRESDIDTQAIADYRARRPSTLSRRVDPLLDDIVVRALAHDRNGRFESAQAFMQALTGWLTRHAPQTTQESIAEFMGELFGDAREADHAAYTKLLEGAPQTAAWERDARRRATRDIRPPTEHEAIAPGEVLADRYRVERTLGQGGMGMVYLAEHLGVGRQVAVKVLTHDWSRHEVVARRFKEEARAANAAGHPNIVEVHDAGELDDGRLYMAMELLGGHSLWDELVERGRLDVGRACTIIATVASAIDAAHRVGIVHRDLKPDNVMLLGEGADEVVKVLDFGISASAVRGADEQRLTRPGHCVGTPEYMAPEQAKGHDATARFDIYALGVMLYELICGSPPFESENMVEVLTRKATEPAPDLGQRRLGLPDALVELCHACLQVDPDQRPATAGQVADALQTIVAGLSDVSFDAALDAAASGSKASPAAVLPLPKQDTEPAPVRPGRSPVSASVPAARRRRMAMGAFAGLGVVAAGLLWWRLSAEATPERPTAPAQIAAVAPPGDAVETLDAPKPATPERTVEDPPVEPPVDVEPDPAVDPPVEPRRVRRPPPEDDTAATPEPGVDIPPDVDAPPELPDVIPAAEPQESRAPAPKSDTAGASSAACEQTRARANKAFTARDFRGTLGLLKPRKCWKGHRAKATRMRVESLFQTHKYDACVEAGSGSSDAAVQGIVRKCRSKT